ncbi:MAG: 50S ribosomal protein L3 [Candidatus Levybacteria bacterium RIFCSPLOWO2_02_FULL_37_10]|nr:MAG: 50S ribosomal protein L3 [Candidatus Levybacteria bacterium RIFCSPHIGHO2_01_FULL_37_33]OGH17493.1 MAG: 50S ribosomal protein L3 [Candidatus Levybacteria bacterium RIFCSPHIGHO2_02_FULL_37_11]OGH29405.1 MAG: 50S ribosomal protein L3 [Candidatus Levybacteria bacterium RIFCSPHIGHO2_12_FULL_37_12]OGH32913.1 MAG: 50S ribosomal protein L3 [Candidatus Levybacteria bacterium RIFCSPLOWO2_01_FULL_36_54]OGH43295.1 MAG: 50S ribosomal protein L3 [Candidatus Levybacteria bacterium RIFCSPLOWO2_02_FULL_
MTLQAIIGQKIDQTQKFLENGTRIPVTRLWVKENVVVSHKTIDKDNYSAIQLGFGQKKKAGKAQMGQTKGAGLTTAPKFLKEVRMEKELSSVGETINAAEVFKPGDMINVTGISKGKGYAGVVKRHHFKGGPRTHGQSDRERAPGSIGQTTTPGRVYKGKRMAGRMGNETATIRNLEVVDVSEDTILVKGLVPGGRNSLIMVKKVGENKKFVPLYKDAVGTEDLPQVSDDVRQGKVRGGNELPHSAGDARVSDEEQTNTTPSLSDDSQNDSEIKEKDKSGSVISSPENGQSVSSSEDENKEKEDKENAK